MSVLSTAPSKASEPPGGELSGRRLMIVDDDRLNIRVLETILKTEGYVIESAGSGDEALALYERFKPDVVLLDVLLPGMDGFDVCRELHRRYGSAAAPVIFITAKSESDDVVEGFAAGGVDYLPKPFRTKEAVVRIRTHLQRRLLLGQVTRANEAKNRFLGMAAHDLRNPLASIRGLAEFLQDPMMGSLTPDQLDLAKTIETTSQGMLQLVNELLDVATIESGELRLQRELVSVGDLLEKCAQLANMDGARKGTRVEFQDQAGPTGTAAVDGAKMRQVAENLLSNAIKYSPPASTIIARLEASGDRLLFQVLDQGPGIPEGERDRLFQDFGRLSVKPTGGEKSTGLGLAICRKIVEAHRGTITAENRAEGGCAFTVSLPL